MRLRPAIADLRPYEPGRPGADVRREMGVARVVKLASNEGSHGPFPAALDAIEQAAEGLNRYPERSGELRERLAEHHRVGVERVALGNGADALVGNLSAAYLDPGDQAAMCWPSFVSYRLNAVKMGAEAVAAPLRGGAYDLDALAGRIGPRTRLAYVCNPNNPTGGIVSRAQLAAFLDRVPERVLVVVDEAYHEYVIDPDYPDAIAEHGWRPNVCVLRTFSKIYGLAGLRIGYAVAPADVVDAVGRVRNAFDTSELAHVAALASLDHRDELTRRRELCRAGRETLLEGARTLGLQPFPAAANFVCIEVGDGRAMAARLEHDGVIVRPLEPFGAPAHVRVTVGAPEENELLLAALDHVLAAS